MAPSRPNVLFIITDQHRYTSLGHRESGDPVNTPTLDRLFSQGASFERAYAGYPVCSPSRLCLLTGQQAPEAGAWDNKSTLLPDRLPFPQTFSESGYDACLQGKMHLGGNRQFAGFDHRPYGDLTGQTGQQFDPPSRGSFDFDQKMLLTEAGVTTIPESLLQEQAVIRESISFIREATARAEDTPWFLCASLNRPHWPRTAPRRHVETFWPDNVPAPRTETGDDVASHPLTAYLREKYAGTEVTEQEVLRARAGYFACVEYLDEMLGDFLALLDRDGALDSTIVVYTSDHGDMLGEYQLWDKTIWHDLSARVPLLVQLPEHRSGEIEPSTHSTPVSLVDLYPTLCGLTGVEAPSDLAGEDLSEAVQTGVEPDRPPVFVDSFRPGDGGGVEYRMVCDGEYKYVRFREAPDLCFNLLDDPREETNLAANAEGADAAALSRLRDLVAESVDFDDALERRREDEQRSTDFRLGIPIGTGNAYHLADGRVVDAGTPLYHPHTLAEDAAVVFDDYPTDG